LAFVLDFAGIFFGLLPVELLTAVCCLVEQLPRAGLLLQQSFGFTGRSFLIVTALSELEVAAGIGTEDLLIF
jgi:hypothetical protein